MTLLRPQENSELLGHEKAEQQVLEAINGDRLHHSWLITGPQGVGKATLAYRIARFVLANLHPGQGAGGLFASEYSSLHLPPDNPVFQRIAAGGHGDLKIIKRVPDPKKPDGPVRNVITVDQIRDLSGFFAHTSAEGGYRVAIIDEADSMNANAANALLKLLEEPPANSLIMLTSISTTRLLPTIRSRCRVLGLRPLAHAVEMEVLRRSLEQYDEADLHALCSLSEGAPGRALCLAEAEGLETYRMVLGALQQLPRPDYGALHKLADSFMRKEGDARFYLFMELLSLALSRMVRTGVGSAGDGEIMEGETALFQRICPLNRPDRWIDLWEKISRRIGEAARINLDKKQVLLTSFIDLEALARGKPLPAGD